MGMGWRGYFSYVPITNTHTQWITWPLAYHSRLKTDFHILLHTFGLLPNKWGGGEKKKIAWKCLTIYRYTFIPQISQLVAASAFSSGTFIYLTNTNQHTWWSGLPLPACMCPYLTNSYVTQDIWILL